MTFEPEKFVDDLVASLAADASDEVKVTIFTSEKLQEELTGFASEAKLGLTAVAMGSRTVESLDASLRARKSLIVASAQSNAFSIERLAAKAIDAVIKKAREVGT